MEKALSCISTIRPLRRIWDTEAGHRNLRYEQMPAGDGGHLDYFSTISRTLDNIPLQQGNHVFQGTKFCLEKLSGAYLD